MPRSQNGYPAGDKSVLADMTIPGTEVEFPQGLRRGPAGDLLIWVAEQLRDRVEHTNGYGCWGYAYRDIRGGGDLSNHASGTAFDYNAPQHPLGVSGTFSRRQVDMIHAILHEAQGCVRWGGDYSGRVDEMHMEIVASEDECARALRAVRGPDYRPRVELGSRGEYVEKVQEILDITVDGMFGEGTEAAVKTFQREHGLVADGVVGPVTWAALERQGVPGDPVGPKPFGGAIKELYLSLPKETRQYIGEPSGMEYPCPDGVGRFQRFARAEGKPSQPHIYWHPDLGAHLVYGAIMAEYGELDWEKGPLGYPMLSESDWPGTENGRFNLFQYGWIGWAPGEGATAFYRK